MTKKYKVKEIFDTLQGEGARAGERSVFLRLSGCNLWSGKPEDRDKGRGACAKWCDTDFVGGTIMTAEEIAKEMEQFNYDAPPSGRYQRRHRWVVISGGEPMLQLDPQIVEALTVWGWNVAVETNGTIAVPKAMREWIDWLTVSPKRGTELVVYDADEYKVVIPGAGNGSGWSVYELSELQSMTPNAKHYIQPEDVEGPHLVNLGSKRYDAVSRENFKLAADFVMSLPGWRLSLQLHKLVGLR